MRLNTLVGADGSRTTRVRVGRGIGSGMGKTCGRGHKGQHSREGGSHKPGFEGGQMPLQRRLPKVGFRSRTKGDTQQVFLYKLNALTQDTITPDVLREAGLLGRRAKRAKVVGNAKVERAIKLSGIHVSSGAKAAIEAAGGSVE